MKLNDFLDLVAYKAEWDSGLEDGKTTVYLSKFDDSYITMVGQEDNVEFLADREITKELTHGVGYSPKDNKWYGWSHRAIYGFEVGSSCKKGDCHYVASTPEELINNHANFFGYISQQAADNAREECQILQDRSGIRILNAPLNVPVVEDFDQLDGYLDGTEPDLPQEDIMPGFTILKCGRGEWVAKTMEDAKQMAIDFNEGVS